VKISVALAGIQRLYIDTAPFIYYIEKHPDYGPVVRRIFEVINTSQIEVLTSVITLAETLTKPLKSGDKTVEQAYRALLQHTQHVTLLPVTVAVADETANLRARYNLRTPDALQLAAALDERCDTFLTNDLTLRRITEVKILILDDLALDPPT